MSNQQPSRLPATAPLKVGVVGIGWAGQQHIKAYKNIDGVELVAVAAMEEDLLASIKADYGIPHTFARWDDLITEFNQRTGVSHE